ncbi:hypothetical protein QM565_30470 [Geitlerinema splendidum]|nr:hypothetical protein [Geitlerinema splendidum]
MAVRDYYTCNGRIIGEKRSDEERSRDYICDPWGNVIAVYQADWQIAAITYDPWGEQLSNWNASSYRYLWGGGIGYRQTNKEWATHYVRARHYSFMDGTWTTIDPLWPQEPAYQYVGNRVTRSIDPSGTYSIQFKNCDSDEQRRILDRLRRYLTPGGGSKSDIEGLMHCVEDALGQCKPGRTPFYDPFLHIPEWYSGQSPLKIECHKSSVKECKGKCGWSKAGNPPQIHICLPASYSRPCGPLHCLIMHEMIHIAANVGHAKGANDFLWKKCMPYVEGCRD